MAPVINLKADLRELYGHEPGLNEFPFGFYHKNEAELSHPVFRQFSTPEAPFVWRHRRPDHSTDRFSLKLFPIMEIHLQLKFGFCLFFVFHARYWRPLDVTADVYGVPKIWFLALKPYMQYFSLH